MLGDIVVTDCEMFCEGAEEKVIRIEVCDYNDLKKYLSLPDQDQLGNLSTKFMQACPDGAAFHRCSRS
jgi:hypothetical protein